RRDRRRAEVAHRAVDGDELDPAPGDRPGAHPERPPDDGRREPLGSQLLGAARREDAQERGCTQVSTKSSHLARSELATRCYFDPPAKYAAACNFDRNTDQDGPR